MPIDVACKYVDSYIKLFFTARVFISEQAVHSQPVTVNEPVFSSCSVTLAFGSYWKTGTEQ
jgi:hypothetical protein